MLILLNLHLKRLKNTLGYLTHLLPGLFVDSKLYFAVSALAQLADDVKPVSNIPQFTNCRT
jgi:hypothetical protein